MRDKRTPKDVCGEAMFILYRMAFGSARNPHRIGFLLTQKNGDFGAISVRVDFQYIYVRQQNRGNAWKVPRKRKSWTSLNFSFRSSALFILLLFYLRE